MDLLASIVRTLGTELKDRGRRGQLVGLCPFHPEQTPSFTVHSRTQRFVCFGCGASGGPIEFVIRHAGVTPDAAKAWIAAHAGETA